MPPLTKTRSLNRKMAEFTAGTLRGFALDYTTDYTPQDFMDLAATGATVCRMPIHLNKKPDNTGYLAPDLTAAINTLNQCAPLGIRVILVLVPLPDGHSSEWWANPDLQQDLTTQWVAIARQVKRYPALIAYDILNEPVGAPTDGVGYQSYKTWWLSISQVICTALRAADRSTPIMVEPANWGLPDQFWLNNCVKVTGLVASFHWYESRAYTHQGAGEAMGTALPVSDYSEILVHARDFAAKHGVPMFVGEFNATRWAPQNEVWLARAINLFNTEDWGWCVHVWRGWEGWDIEIPGTVAMGTGVPADRRADSPALLAVKAGILA